MISAAASEWPGKAAAGDSFAQWDVHLLGKVEHKNFLGGMRRLRIEERPRLIFDDPFPGSTRTALGNRLTVELRQPGFVEPRTTLVGRTPLEVYRGLPPANEAPRFEPRPHWPRKSRCASPAARLKGRCGARFQLVVSRFENRRHLPVVELRRAA